MYLLNYLLLLSSTLIPGMWYCTTWKEVREETQMKAIQNKHHDNIVFPLGVRVAGLNSRDWNRCSAKERNLLHLKLKAPAITIECLFTSMAITRWSGLDENSTFLNRTHEEVKARNWFEASEFGRYFGKNRSMPKWFVAAVELLTRATTPACPWLESLLPAPRRDTVTRKWTSGVPGRKRLGLPVSDKWGQVSRRVWEAGAPPRGTPTVKFGL